MKQRISFSFFLCALIFQLQAQLNDAQWMLGPVTSTIDFRDTIPVNTSIAKSINTYFTNAANSDTNGEMLYYTNGIYIAGKQSNGDSILNGNGLSPCNFTTQNITEGLPIPQGCLFLNQPGSSRYYYLFHFSIDSTAAFTLYYSLIDVQGNFGLGAVISKNNIFYRGFTRTGGIAACKHANGRDWWVIIPSRNNNLYRKFLLTPNGIADTLIQNIGPSYTGPGDNSYARFSLDGTKYVIGAYVGKISVFEFDRCTGVFSNAVVINNADPGFSSGASSVEFSPNGRFVYVIESVSVKQYDLNNANIQDSVLIYRYNGFGGFDQFSLAYDGRIYGSTWDGGLSFLHVINNPDELGLNCNFVYGGQPTLSNNSINVSNTANPRLGALIGSSCDTIPTGISSLSFGEGRVRCFPNPADKSIYIEMPQQGNYIFELINEQGQTVERRETHQVDIINVQGLDNAAYILSVKDAKTGKQLASAKAIVQHP